MNITLKLFASLTDYLPPESKYTNIVALDIAPEQRASQTLAEGDVLAIWPSIAGG